MLKKVSVIITVYNMEKYIEKCIKSVLNQTYRNIEIVIVNDGSTDNSEKIIETYTKKYSNIKNIIQPNSGPAVAKNTGLDNATGEYIMILDADDWIDTDFIEKLVSIAEKDLSDIVFFDSIKELENGKKIGKIEMSKYSKNEKDEILRLHITSTMPAGAHKIIRRKAILDSNARFANQLKRGEELQFSIQVIKAAKKISFCDDTYYHCIQRENSQSKKETKNFIENIDNLYNVLAKENILNEYQTEYKLAIIRFLILEVYNVCCLNKYIDARKKMNEIVKVYKNKYNIEGVQNYKTTTKEVKMLYFLLTYKLNWIVFQIVNTHKFLKKLKNRIK